MRFQKLSKAIEYCAVRNREKSHTYLVVWDGQSFVADHVLNQVDGEVVWKPKWLVL
jgi:hypothetical protein